MALGFRGPAASAQDEFEGWHLEPGVSQAHLVMIARVASISRLTVVEGAKTDIALREYRFQPVRLLKGIFQRDQLSMTAADLGCPADSAESPCPLEQGEFRLLILAQQKGRLQGCVSAAPGATTFAERVPLLSGPEDPLVGVVETLIQVADSRSRHQRAMRLIEQLTDASGLSAVPLLSSLQSRADWAAAEPLALAAVTRLSLDPHPAVRGAALAVLRDMLASGIMPDEPVSPDAVANALAERLDSAEAPTSMRLDALEALGHLLAAKADIDWAREVLIAQLTSAATHAERVAAARALARIDHPQAVAALLGALDKLPLDETPARESDYIWAAAQLDPAATEQALIARLDRSITARQSLEAEVKWLGTMHCTESVPLFLGAAVRLNLQRGDRHHIARALGQLGDDRAVPVLTGWLRGDDFQLKEIALAALESIDSPLAAREARPLLKSEPHLAYKLRLARLLARHGIGDGYALATEHLADDGQTATSALVLAAIDDPRTTKDLSVILASRPDRSWHAAALTGLAAIGDETAREQLRTILADDRHPLVAEAAEAAGLAADAELLVPLATLIQSRNGRIARSSLVALRRFLTGVRSLPGGLTDVPADDVDHDPAPAADIPLETRAAIEEGIASIAVDTYVESGLRHEALTVARLLGGEGYRQLLSDLADQAELEGSRLLAEVQSERRRLRGVDESP